MYNRTLFLSAVALWFYHLQWRHIYVIIIKLTAATKNEIMYKNYISDFSYFEN